MPLFALALKAQKFIPQRLGAEQLQVKAAATTAINEEEAIGIGYKMAREEWPLDKGWYNHAVSHCEITSEFLQRAADDDLL